MSCMSNDLKVWSDAYEFFSGFPRTVANRAEVREAFPDNALCGLCNLPTLSDTFCALCKKLLCVDCIETHEHPCKRYPDGRPSLFGSLSEDAPPPSFDEELKRQGVEIVGHTPRRRFRKIPCDCAACQREDNPPKF
jgi:hypothetical protein